MIEQDNNTFENNLKRTEIEHKSVLSKDEINQFANGEKTLDELKNSHDTLESGFKVYGTLTAKMKDSILNQHSHYASGIPDCTRKKERDTFGMMGSGGIGKEDHSFESIMLNKDKTFDDFKCHLSMYNINQKYFHVEDRVIKILEQFENGRERYAKDAVFNKCVDELAHNSSEFEIINDLIKIVNAQQEQLKEYMEHFGTKMMLMKSEFCICGVPQTSFTVQENCGRCKKKIRK